MKIDLHGLSGCLNIELLETTVERYTFELLIDDWVTSCANLAARVLIVLEQFAQQL